MLRPTLRAAVFLLLVLTAVWIWTIVPRDDATPPPSVRLHESTATVLADGRVRLTVRALGVMGTEVVLTLYGEDEERLRTAATEAFRRMEVLEDRTSRWRPGSDVSRVNAGAGEPVGVHAGTFALLERALALGRRTGGAFDVTVGPLVKFWRERETFPSDDEIAEARDRVGLDRVTLVGGSPPAVTLAPGSSLDLGGIAKGTIVDAAAGVLAGHGLASFLINAGGDLLARGPGPDDRGILVALRDPRGAHGATLAGGRLRLRDAALCTSGSYERFRVLDGVRISHIVDPRTGRPVEEAVLQASVVALTCEIADALATSLMVLGPEEGLTLVEAMDEVEALVVVHGPDGIAVRESHGFAAFRAEAGR